MNGSPSLAELEYKRKYDNIVRPVHWDFAGKRGFRRGEEWCRYVPESVVENENLKLPRDYGNKTDHEVRSVALELVLLAAEDENRQLEDLPQADFGHLDFFCR